MGWKNGGVLHIHMDVIKNTIRILLEVLMIPLLLYRWRIINAQTSIPSEFPIPESEPKLSGKV